MIFQLIFHGIIKHLKVFFNSFSMTLSNILKKKTIHFSKENYFLESKQGPSIINSTFTKNKALNNQMNQQFASIIHHLTNFQKISFY